MGTIIEFIFIKIVGLLGLAALSPIFEAIPVFWLIVGGCFLFLFCAELFL